MCFLFWRRWSHQFWAGGIFKIGGQLEVSHDNKRESIGKYTTGKEYKQAECLTGFFFFFNEQVNIQLEAKEAAKYLQGGGEERPKRLEAL